MSLPKSERMRPCVVPIEVANFFAGGKDTRGCIIPTPGEQYAVLGVINYGPCGPLVVGSHPHWGPIRDIMHSYTHYLAKRPNNQSQGTAIAAYNIMIDWEIAYELEV